MEEKKPEEIIPVQVPRYRIKQKTRKEVKCKRCGELYPEETLHKTCIICGDPL
jgi:rRNA maturation endonuclease Nob1